MKPAEDSALYLWCPPTSFTHAETFPGPVFAEAATLPAAPVAPLPEHTPSPSIALDALRG